jgi:hypothetical protein
MTKYTLIVTFFSLLCVNIPAADIYKSSQNIALRAPAVPLITSDPYLSIWSPYDTLTEGNTEHWTGASHPLIGAVRIDGKTYRFMGKDKLNLTAILPMTHGSPWEAAYTFDKPTDNWTDVNFDDSTWKTGKAAFGTADQPRVETPWLTKDIWIRRTFNLNEDLTKEEILLKYSHDDIFELYLNGEKLVATDYSWKNDVVLTLSDIAKKKLKTGKNVIAAHGHNRTGGAYVDFGLFKKNQQFSGFETEALQTSVDVLPTQTFYTFTCGPVELDLVFTAPLLLTDLDLLSTPINYISYRVKSLDKKRHSVQIYFETTPELAVNDITQAVVSERIEKNGLVYLKTGTIDQPITKRIGDDVRIDWGYAYLASDNAKNKNLALGEYFPMKEAFVKNGGLLPSVNPQDLSSKLADSMTVLAYSDDLGTVDATGKTGYLMLGYDDIYAIEYFYQRRPAYWKHDGKVDIFQAFEKAQADYEPVMQKSRDFDSQLLADAKQAGGVEYAELCALAYRQAIAAHKLITDEQGNLLFFSKENNSNGCINTVDITYPSAPLFLLYNPDLLKGMLTSIFYYSESGRWQKPYPAHDLGTYPIANGQLYGGDMPVEEGGNMILLTTAISIVEGHADYALQHWETLTTWVNYLAEKGLDPENQLCTDDFAGHLAHNANLSIKAIMAIAGYGVMAEMLGKKETAAEYIQMARTMATIWETKAIDGDHYKLAFDKPGTWSQKYNLVWDKLFKLNIFPSKVIDTELPFYLKKQKEHKYGLPLDSREDYTKSDWVLWIATMASSDDVFKQIVAPMYKYANETTSRVPLSDWHDTNTGKMMSFKARSVVGGYYIKMLEEKLNQ